MIRQSNSTLTDETIRHPTAAIDLAAVMKAAQALSEMIHLDQLIATLMQVVIENAGAETGALILLEDDRLTVVAQCSGSRQCDLEKIAVADCATIPVSVIHSVERTQETLVFDNAVSEPSFLTDPYIQNQQTRSLLCMPILKQNQLVGILYLENNLSTGVFTSDRLQVLKLLMAQAAISLENARLYERLADYSETLEKKVEERTQALQRSEAKFRNIFENSQVGIFRTRLSDGLILDANQRFANLFGFDSPEEVIGLKHTTDCYVNPSDRQQAIELLKRNGELQNFEVQLQKRDGTLFWGLYSTRLNAADECMEGVIADISEAKRVEDERKRTEAALRESEQLLDVSFSQSLDGFFIMMLDQPVQWDSSVDKDKVLDYVFEHQQITEINDAMLAQYGASREQFIDITPNDLYAHDLAYGKSVWRRFFDAGKLHIETNERRLDGTAIWVEGNYICLYDSQERIIGHFGIQRDISDRKQAEASLQASKAELRTLIEAIPDPLCVVTAEGRVIETVEGNPRQLYSPVEEKIGKTLHQIFEEEQADEFMNYIQQALRTQQVLTVEYSLQIDGRETWFSARIAPIRHERVIWLSRDITALKQAEAASILEERNRMAREIHDTLAQAFTGVLVHMGAISRLATTNPEAIQSHIQTVRDLARNGLTEARRSVSALRPQLLEEGNLWTALERFVFSLQSSTETRLICEIIGTPYALPPDTENNLLRIGQEAFTNAVKYAHANEIRIELVYEPTQCCLRIRDDGQGFEVNNATLSQGFGLLGMSERAEHIGAQLSIDSQPGQGTEVSVSVQWEAAG